MPRHVPEYEEEEYGNNDIEVFESEVTVDKYCKMYCVSVILPGVSSPFIGLSIRESFAHYAMSYDTIAPMVKS